MFRITRAPSARSNLILVASRLRAPCTEPPIMPESELESGRSPVFAHNTGEQQGILPKRFGWSSAIGLFLGFFLLLILTHAPLLRLPYFWDEAGYYIPAARDLLAGSLIPHSTPSNAHPPLVMAW